MRRLCRLLLCRLDFTSITHPTFWMRGGDFWGNEGIAGMENAKTEHADQGEETPHLSWIPDRTTKCKPQKPFKNRDFLAEIGLASLTFASAISLLPSQTGI